MALGYLLSNSTSNPIFESIEMTMTFDYKWRMQKIETNEGYECAKIEMGEIKIFE